MGAMKRIVTAGLLAACACVLLQIESAPAQTAAPGLRVAQLAQDYVPPRRKLRRVPIYPREHTIPTSTRATIRARTPCANAMPITCRRPGRAARWSPPAWTAFGGPA